MPPPKTQPEHPTVAIDEARYWSRIGTEWAATHPTALWRRHVDSLHATLLKRWLGDDRAARVLKTDLFDEAVGAGVHAQLAARCDVVVGMDLAVSTAEAARRGRIGFAAIAADTRALPFRDGAFDTVVSLSTLDHFRTHAELVASVREVARVIRPGGTLLLTLDNAAHPLVALRNALGHRRTKRLGLVPYFVGATVGPAGLRRLLAHTPLTALEVTATTHVPRVIAVALAGWVERRASEAFQRRFLDWLRSWERLAEAPTRFLTGHYVAVRARKRHDIRPST